MIKITQFTVAYLSERMSIPVSGEIPASPPVSFVVVEKLDGGERNYIAESTIRLSCYADTLARAEDLSHEVQKTMKNMVFAPEISGMEFGGDHNATDTQNKCYCFEVVYHITHY